MSEQIDERVVQMRFNNQQFEDGVKTTVKTVENLKKSLDLSGSSKHLLDFQKTANNFSISGMASGIDSIVNRLSTLGIVGMTVIQNITNSALNAGKKIASALTIDPVTDGFKEYELKMNAIQTLQTNTADKGTTLEDINKSLAELNEYSDKTIYNFAQMTDNASKFSAAGITLEDSVTNVKGLANVAAGFGVDAEKMAGATYQMTQAMQNGRVIWQDWNSLAQAGMGGKRLQDEMMKTADSLGIVRDKSMSFKDSLQDGWLTAEVFTKTMAKMAKDPALLLAATNVTTFTKLLSTMKEAMASGWTTTWEKILGDKNESTSLFTSINNAFSAVVSKSADARNSMLDFWKANGGRKDFIIGISNALIAMGKIIKPIEDAMSKVFPPLTGQNLLDITKAFKDLMEWLVISDGTADKIRRTFEGFFSILDIGRQIIVGFVDGLLGILGVSTPIGDIFLSITASIGDFFVGLNNLYKKFGAFNSQLLPAIKDLFIKSFYTSISTALSKTSELFKNFIDIFKNFVNTLKSSGSGVIKFVGNQIDALIETISRLAKEITNIIGEQFYGFSETISGLANTVGNVKDRFIDLIYSFKSTNQPTKEYSNSINDATNKNIKMGESISGVNSFVSILVDGFKNLISKMKPMLNSIGVIFGKVRDEIKRSIKDITFEEVISAIQGFITGSLFLSLRKLAKVLSESIPALTEGVTQTLDSVRDSIKAYQQQVKSKILMNIAKALAIMTISIYALSQIDKEKLKVSLLALTAMFAQLMGGFYGFTKIIDGKTFASLIPLSVAMLSMATSVGILAMAVVKLADVEWEKLKTGLKTIGILLGAMVIVADVLAINNAQITSSSLAMIGMATAISILSGAVYILGSMDTNVLRQGFLAMGFAIAQLALAMAILPPNLSTSALALMAMAGALTVLIVPIAALGNMDPEKLKQGFIAVSIALTELSLAMRLIPPNLGTSALGMIAMASALSLIVVPIAILGNMDQQTIAQGFLAMSLSLMQLSLAMAILPPNVGLSALGLIAMAAALTLIIVPITILGNMPVPVIITGILGMAGALLVLGGVSFLLSFVAPELIGISTAIGILAAGLGLIGIGVAAFSAGVVLLVGSIGAIILAIPGIGQAVRSLLEQINKSIPMIEQTIGLVLQSIINLMPRIKKTIQVLQDTILELLVEYIPKILDAVILLLIGIVKVIAKYTKPLSDIIAKFILEMIDKLDLENTFKKVGKQLIDGLIAGALGEFKTALKIFGLIGETIIKKVKEIFGIHSPSKEFRELGQNTINSLGLGAEDQEKNTTSIFGDVTTNIGNNSGVNYLVDKFRKSGQDMINSLGAGAKEKENSTTKTVKDVSNNVAENGSGFLSKLLMGSGRSMIDSLGLGGKKEEKSTTKTVQDISSNIGSGVGSSLKKSTEKSAKGTSDVIKTEFEKMVDYIEERKYYNKISLEEELKLYEDMTNKYKAGTEERKKADREIYRIKKELVEKDYNNSKKWIDEKKYYNQLSLEEELSAQERMLKKHSTDAEKSKEIEHEIYRIKKELVEKDYNNSKKWIDEKKYYNQLTLEEELSAQERLLKRYSTDAEKRKEIEHEIYRLKKDINIKEYNDYKKMIDDENEHNKRISKSIYDRYKTSMDDKKYYNNLSLNQELSILEKLQKETKLTGEERKNVEREVYRVKEELRKTDLQYRKDVEKVEKETNDKLIKMEEEYLEKTKDINDKLKKDIDDVNAKYNDAVESRTKSLYNSYGLFDEITKKDAVSSSTLLQNIKDQVDEFKVWQKTIKELKSKGVDIGLINELTDMGPKSLSEIKALNSMGSYELDSYVLMWKTKHEQASSQALKELDGMRVETITKIETMTIEVSAKLAEYNEEWLKNNELLKSETALTLTDLKTDWLSKIGEVTSSTEKEVEAMTSNIQKTIKSPNWSQIGSDIVNGIKNGILSKAQSLASQTANVALQALQSAKDALGIKSPSRAFAEVGKYSMEGFINGIRNYSGSVISTVSNVGSTAINSLKTTMATIGSALDGSMDMSPVIRPVIDLSNVMAGGQLINGMLSKTNTIDLTSTINKLPNMTREVDTTQTSQNGSNPGQTNISYVQNNYSPKELSRIDIYRQTRNQISAMKGLVKTT